MGIGVRWKFYRGEVLVASMADLLRCVRYHQVISDRDGGLRQNHLLLLSVLPVPYIFMDPPDTLPISEATAS